MCALVRLSNRLYAVRLSVSVYLCDRVHTFAYNYYVLTYFCVQMSSCPFIRLHVHLNDCMYRGVSLYIAATLTPNQRQLST